MLWNLGICVNAQYFIDLPVKYSPSVSDSWYGDASPPHSLHIFSKDRRVCTSCSYRSETQQTCTQQAGVLVQPVSLNSFLRSCFTGCVTCEGFSQGVTSAHADVKQFYTKPGAVYVCIFAFSVYC